MKYFVFLLLLSSCTTVRHKYISHTYHGTNGNGGHWIIWKKPYKIEGDSVAISANGFNVSDQKKIKSGVLVVFSKKDSLRLRNIKDYESIKVKVPAGRYRLIYTPLDGNTIGVSTKYFNFNPGDDIRLQTNVVDVERHLHEDWNAKYLNAIQKSRRARKIERFLKRVERLRAKGKFDKATRLRLRKSKRWPYVY